MTCYRTCCSAAQLNLDLTYTSEVKPICCIDCGCIIAQYEHYTDGCIEGWGYRDTIERIGSADSLRCGRCYQRFTFAHPYRKDL
jgi:hypothetical protein